MGNHSVALSPESGKYCVMKDGKVLHTFPSEGEAHLQAKYLDEQEAQATHREAKTEEPEKETKGARGNDDEPKPHGRHR